MCGTGALLGTLHDRSILVRLERVLDRLLASLAAGLTQRQACMGCGICENTLSAWRKQDLDLESRIEAAREVARQTAREGIKTAGEKSWRALAEWLKPTFPSTDRGNINLTATAKGSAGNGGLHRRTTKAPIPSVGAVTIWKHMRLTVFVKNDENDRPKRERNAGLKKALGGTPVFLLVQALDTFVHVETESLALRLRPRRRCGTRPRCRSLSWSWSRPGRC